MIHRHNLILLTAVLAVLFLAPLAFATGHGNVRVTFPDSMIFYDEYNALQIYIENDDPLYGMSIGLELKTTGPAYLFQKGFGTKPSGEGYVKEINDAQGAFDPAGLQVMTSALPETLWLSGTSTADPLPSTEGIHNVMRYELTLIQYSGQSGLYWLSIKPIFVPGTPGWAFTDSVGTYAPFFQGRPVSSSENPDVPAVQFRVLSRCKSKIGFMDANGDCSVNISDVVYLISWIFAGGPEPSYGFDPNFDGTLNISDAVTIIHFIFGKQ